MFLQGDLQAVFDALYSIGAIDPILKQDWQKINSQMLSEFHKARSAFEKVNDCHGDRQALLEQLKAFDSDQVNFVAMEVAREFAEFTDRQSLH